MTPKEFQLKHGLTDEELEFIGYVCKETKGQVASVTEKRLEPTRKININKNLVSGPFKMTKSRSFYKGQWNRETHK